MRISNLNLVFILVIAALLTVIFFQKGEIGGESETTTQLEVQQPQKSVLPESRMGSHSVQIKENTVLPAAKSTSYQITPNEARDQIDKANQNTDLWKKRLLLSNILFNLAQSGYFLEALELIDQVPGNIRESQIQMIMEGNNVPIEQRLEMLNRFSDDNDRLAGSKGLFRSMSIDEILDFDISSYSFSDESLRKNVGSAISKSIQEKIQFLHDTEPVGFESSENKLMNRALEMAGEKQITASQLGEVLDSTSALSPFDRWEYVQSVGFNNDDAGLDWLQRSTIERMVIADSTKAISELTAYVDSHPDSNALGAAVSSWYRLDGAGANAWIVGPAGKLPPLQKDRVLEVVIRMALEDGDQETAESWAAQLSDPALKEKILRK